MGLSRLPRPPQESKATQGPAQQASRFRIAGVEDRIMRAQMSWEPKKPYYVLRVVAGGGNGQGTTGGRSLDAAGWRIGV
jgi:hypothetical protein